MENGARPRVLMLFDLPASHVERLRDACDLQQALDTRSRATVIEQDGATIDAVLTSGNHGLTRDEMLAMPRLGLVAAYGAGCEAIDLAAAREFGLSVCNGPGTNDDSVADHALALLLAGLRQVSAMDAAVRQGQWRDDVPLCDQLAGSRVGLIGMGRIGQKIAKRMAAFDAEPGYHSRHPLSEQPWPHFASVQSLASWADHLVIAAPGGPSTRHLVNATVLAELGPRSWLVNVGRGSIVDEDALAHALEAGRLGGAALDVYEDEPALPTRLVALPRLILTPHVAGTSPQALQAATDLFLDNLRRHRLAQPLRTPVSAA